jgi:D-glycero-alpha-D-manno-heptose-7-phosphate kinase
MVGTRTPFRMSFVGGGSDLKEFYTQSPGCVISATINKYMYIFVHKYFDNRIQVKYSKTELVERIANIKHPIVREVLTKFNLQGIDINSIADIPSGTGLGSSSSYTVGLFNALYNYIGKNYSKEQLAKDACELEIDILKEPIGKQDQYAAAYGGLNLIRFLPNGGVKIEPIKMENKAYKQLENNLLLFFTGTTRNASDVLIDQRNNLLSEESKFDTLIQMTNLVEKAKTALIQSNLDNFGKILDENWQLKKSLSKKISNNDIENIYSLAKNNGALGGKILGAGGGGFALFYCEQNKQERLRNALNKLKEVNFMFEKLGTKTLEFIS